METRISIKTQLLILLVLMMSVSSIVPARAVNPPPNAISAAAVKSLTTPSTEKTQTVNLGKINVTAMKELVKTLQLVKVALHTPFTDHAADVDQMVCQIQTGGGGAALECGTQGWYSRRRETTQLSLLCRCAANFPKLGHPWHAYRAVNYRQLMALRELLKELPLPGQAVKVVGDNGQVLMTVKASANAPATDN